MPVHKSSLALRSTPVTSPSSPKKAPTTTTQGAARAKSAVKTGLPRKKTHQTPAKKAGLGRLKTEHLPTIANDPAELIELVSKAILTKNFTAANKIITATPNEVIVGIIEFYPMDKETRRFILLVEQHASEMAIALKRLENNGLHAE